MDFDDNDLVNEQLKPVVHVPIKSDFKIIFLKKSPHETKICNFHFKNFSLSNAVQEKNFYHSVVGLDLQQQIFICCCNFLAHN
jgi:hypothetical protein